MGEEEKKPEEKKMEEKQPEEPKKAEEKKEEPKAEKPSEDKKEDKKAEEPKDPPPPPPPQEIVLSVYMHCEGCARKVRRCLKNFEGVEEVETDCKTHKVVVKGAKADPVKVLERVQMKSHRQVELLSPIPKPPAPKDAKKADEKEVAKPLDKKQEVITVVLKIYMHCEACSQEIKRRILRMDGVESVEPDLKSSQVTVKGVLDPPKLVEYVYKRTGKQALIVKQEAEKKVEEEKPKEEKKAGDGGAKDTGKGGEAAATEKKDGGGEAAVAAPPEAVVVAEGEGANVVELKKNEFYYNYPHNYQINPYPDPYPYPYPNTNPYPYPYPNTNPYPYPYPAPAPMSELYAYPPQHAYPPPQMFSDENPNACSVM
ncbi:heavy metal-associated isoprenylated plant protein 7-like isoform X2 [Camellia sinensis]|uniref:heavy metal-associated isoprenylated plant protein 7-like isoform X2 n=1 Tax=Camellia sinensis TaxID=4442 RepID=UPI0010357835|nr:heavy metal-associated isoprenylated plant protein 7-like isoform X2 [Camellia sinensis]